MLSLTLVMGNRIKLKDYVKECIIKRLWPLEKELQTTGIEIASHIHAG